jgi:hypothetical protein
MEAEEIKMVPSSGQHGGLQLAAGSFDAKQPDLRSLFGKV